MCGIAAVIAASPANLSFVQSMCDLIRHRGPDGEGYTTFDHNLTPMPSGCADTPLAVYTMDAPYAPRRRIKENGDGAAIAALGHRRLAIVDQSPLAHHRCVRMMRATGLVITARYTTTLHCETSCGGQVISLPHKQIPKLSWRPSRIGPRRA